MTPQELAARLHGREIGREITKAEAAEAKAAGLVVVFGYSDDGVELRGAIDDEIGAYDGTTLRITPLGRLPEWPEEGMLDESEAEDYFRLKLAGFQTIEAVWCPKETEADTTPFASWAFKTAIPHATFDVMEDGDLFCRGIVFAMADVVPAPAELPAATSHVDRMRAEHADLEAKLTRLRAFCSQKGGVFDSLPSEEKQRLTEQEVAMAAYLWVLGERIEAAS